MATPVATAQANPDTALAPTAATIRNRLRRARHLLEQALREGSPASELVESSLRGLQAWADAV